MIEVDVWVRGTLNAATHRINQLPADPATWREQDIRTLLTSMLLALEQEKNPGGEPPSVSLRGFSWIVSPYEGAGVIVHLDTQMGTASAGPIALAEGRLTALIAKVMSAGDGSEQQTVH